MTNPLKPITGSIFHRAPVTLFLVVVNVFLYMAASSAAEQSDIPPYFDFGIWQPRLWIGEYWRFLTPMIMHGSGMHLFFNCWFLYLVGNQLETWIGSRLFIIMYILAGIGGNALSALTGDYFSVGASSSLFGMIGFMFMMAYHISGSLAKMRTDPMGRQIITILLINLAFGFMANQSSLGIRIDNAAHIGGLIVGMVFGHIWYVIAIYRRRNIAKEIGLAALTVAAMVTVCVYVSRPRTEDAFYHFLLAGQADDAKDVEKTIFHLNKALELDPWTSRHAGAASQDYSIYSRSGMLFYIAGKRKGQGRNAEALALYARALESREAETRNGLRPYPLFPMQEAYAELLREEGHLEEAARQFLGHAEGRRKTAMLNQAADIYIELGDYDKAEEVLNQKEYRPDSASRVVRLAAIHLARGNRDEARTLLRETTELAPEKPDAWFMLAELAVEDNDLEAAADAYRGFLSSNCNPARFKERRATARKFLDSIETSHEETPEEQ
jgi:membrane associated rhomboid family serine protease